MVLPVVGGTHNAASWPPGSSTGQSTGKPRKPKWVDPCDESARIVGARETSGNDSPVLDRHRGCLGKLGKPAPKAAAGTRDAFYDSTVREVALASLSPTRRGAPSPSPCAPMPARYKFARIHAELSKLRSIRSRSMFAVVRKTTDCSSVARTTARSSRGKKPLSIGSTFHHQSASIVRGNGK